MKIGKIYQYHAVIISDRGHLDDPEFLEALNQFGARGWKHKEEQAKGANKQVVLLEREVVLDSPIEVPEENGEITA